MQPLVHGASVGRKLSLFLRLWEVGWGDWVSCYRSSLCEEEKKGVLSRRSQSVTHL